MLTESLQFLQELQLFGSSFGLERTFQLAELAGSPHSAASQFRGTDSKPLRFVHVAGTNGKGSVCAMLEAVYRAAGLRVGLYTSPHLVRFGERIQINHQPISDHCLVQLVQEMKGLLSGCPELRPTFFEVVTVMALIYFRKQNVDLVIWETGLGGRLDATNIITPLVSVITNVQLDHTEWLGSNLAAIAGEKGGIIKPGVPLVTGCQEEEALAVLRRIAQSQNAPFHQAVPGSPSYDVAAGLTLNLLGRHQISNAALVLKTTELLRSHFPVDGAVMEQALRTVEWPGRFQVLPFGEGRLILDGCHNLDGVQSFKQAFVELFPGHKASFIVGMLEDKNWKSMVREIEPLASDWVVVPVNSKRTVPAEKLADELRSIRPGVEVTVSAAAREALDLVSGKKLAVVAGSLYLIGEVLEILQGARTSERGLNEWSARLKP